MTEDSDNAIPNVDVAEPTLKYVIDVLFGRIDKLQEELKHAEAIRDYHFEARNTQDKEIKALKKEIKSLKQNI